MVLQESGEENGSGRIIFWSFYGMIKVLGLGFVSLKIVEVLTVVVVLGSEEMLFFVVLG